MAYYYCDFCGGETYFDDADEEVYASVVDAIYRIRVLGLDSEKTTLEILEGLIDD